MITNPILPGFNPDPSALPGRLIVSPCLIWRGFTIPVVSGRRI